MRLMTWLLCLAALPALAQDRAAEYSDAVAVFGLGTGSPGDWEGAANAMFDMIGRIEGDWVDAQVLSGGEPVLNAENFDRSCEVAFHRITRDGDLGFTLHRQNRDGPTPLVQSFQLLGGRTFQVTTDMTALQDMLDIDQDRRPFAPLFVDPAYRGTAQLFQPSDNALIIQTEGIPARIMIRCP